MDDLLTYLPYILPTKCTLTTDKNIIVASQHFKSLYGDLILKLLWHIDAIPKSINYVKKSALKTIVDQVRTLIELQSKGCYIWKQEGLLKIMPTQKMKSNGFKSYIKQKTVGKIDPHVFMIEKKQDPGFNDNCIVGMSFQSLLILFSHLLTQVRSMDQNKYFNLNVAQLFNVVDATNQLNSFGYAFLYRQPRVKGANQTASGKNNTRTTVSKIVQHLRIMSNKATSSAVRELVRQEFKKSTGKKLNYSDKTLTDIIIDAAGHSHSS